MVFKKAWESRGDFFHVEVSGFTPLKLRILVLWDVNAVNIYLAVNNFLYYVVLFVSVCIDVYIIV